MTSQTCSQEFEVCPFTIVQDTNEGGPWRFEGIKTRAKAGVRLPLVVKTVKKPLWSWDRKEWGVGLADYSIENLEYEIQIERKSLDDLFGTLGSRRENFKNEIARLNQQCKIAYVIIEAGYGHIASYKGPGAEPSSVIGTMISWSQRFPRVHWIPAGSRDMAERLAFRFLERFWLDREESAKVAAKEQKRAATMQPVANTEGSTTNDTQSETAASNQMERTQSENSGSNRH